LHIDCVHPLEISPRHVGFFYDFNSYEF